MPRTSTSNEFDASKLFDFFIEEAEQTLIEKEETIPTISEFIANEIDLGGIELTKQQLLILKCLYGEPLSIEEISILEFWKREGRCTWEPNRRYQELVMCSGRRSGKSLLAALVTVYEFYKLCKLKNPQKYFNISGASAIGILALATTADQAKRTIFREITGTVKSCKFLVDLEKQGKLFIGKEEIAYEDKRVYLYSGNSKSGAQVGASLKLLVMDEVARFADESGKSNALLLWQNLGVSSAPFGNQAMRVAISSAWEEGDAIEQLYKMAESNPIMLGVNAKTWEINPIHGARDNPVIVSAYATNPILAATEFEGIRPTSANAFLNDNLVKNSFTGYTAVHAHPVIKHDPNPLAHLVISSIETETEYQSVLHIDPAVKKDRYALAAGHLCEADDNWKVVIDTVVAWEPTYEAHVSFSDVKDFITHYHKHRYLRKVTADHYNSEETIQYLNKAGINADIVYFSNRMQVQMYSLLNTLFNEGRIVLPMDSKWRSLLTTELTHVFMTPKGTKIDHPPDGSKDCADAVAAVAWELLKNTDYSSIPKIKRQSPLKQTQQVNQQQVLPQPYIQQPKAIVRAAVNARRNWLRNKINNR